MFETVSSDILYKFFSFSDQPYFAMMMSKCQQLERIKNWPKKILTSRFERKLSISIVFTRRKGGLNFIQILENKFFQIFSFHQKFVLQQQNELFKSLGLHGKALVTSHVAAKLNGYVGGEIFFGKFFEILHRVLLVQSSASKLRPLCF